MLRKLLWNGLFAAFAAAATIVAREGRDRPLEDRDRRGSATQVVTTADRLVERGAAKLQQLSRSLAQRGGVAEQVASDLQEDAAFLRKLKPSLILARARGQNPGNGEAPFPSAGPATDPRPKTKKPGGKGVNPLLVVGGALVAGIVLAKLIDYRGHAHPKLD